jgi:hypothetical protein
VKGRGLRGRGGWKQYTQLLVYSLYRRDRQTPLSESCGETQTCSSLRFTSLARTSEACQAVYGKENQFVLVLVLVPDANRPTPPEYKNPRASRERQRERIDEKTISL